MEGLKVVYNPYFKKEDLNRLGPSLGSAFLNIEYFEDTRKYYSQFGAEVCELGLFNKDDELIAKFSCFTKEYYEKDYGPVKVLIVTDVRTLQTREALLGWSELMLPEILKIKVETQSDYALFYLTRTEKGFFSYFIRPRRSRVDSVRFSQIRKVRMELLHGKGFFSEEPLKYVDMRRAKEEDLERLKGFIKSASLKMPLARSLDEDNLSHEINKLKHFDLENLALAFNSEGHIVGSMGLYDLSKYAKCSFALENVYEPTFPPLQTFLGIASWVTDLRPVFKKREHRVGLLTHMYFNNEDIFYSLLCWWFYQTKKDKTLLMYPYYDGDLKVTAPGSFFLSGFRGDIYLIQDGGERPSNLLKPMLFSESLDVDLPLLI